ncbi:Alpha-D-kanosaminyltransferase [termite gut metagenome]|uniref:Alpha-D-kanosaminyltransferase n=1 Tax=termite gut metagenome TaxID=433724 RepID=A0A5J4SVG2_9ZZZZ
MKILHISKYYPPYRGGIEDVCYNIVNNVSGFEQKVICFNDSRYSILSDVNNVEIIRIGILGEFASQPISFSLYRILRRYIKVFKPDIIHLHLPNPLMCLYILTLIPQSMKLILHWHSDIIAQRKLYKLFIPIERSILKRADKVLVTSLNYLENSIPLHDYKNKSIVLPNMISLEKMKLDEYSKIKITNLIATYKKKKIIFFMGRHVEYKGLEYLLEAERYISSDCIILIAGNGPLTEKLKQTYTSERIVFIGKISNDDVKVYMNTASVFAFPSITKNEAFGVALAEAMYCKAVPVTFAIKGSGVNWVNLKDITGLEVENGNSEEFGKAIDTLLQNNKLRMQFAENGYQRVLENFTMKTIRLQIENIYNSL